MNEPDAIEGVDSFLDQLFNNDSDLTTLTPGKWWPEEAPPERVRPYGLWELHGGRDRRVLQKSVMSRPLMFIKVVCEGKSFRPCHRAMARAHAIVIDARGQAEGIRIMGVVREGDPIRYVEHGSNNTRYNHYGWMYRFFTHPIQ